jgi:hypothetical protein
MKKIDLSVIAIRTDIDNQFKGTITFKDAKNKQVFEYLNNNPKSQKVDIEYYQGEEGIPTPAILEPLTERQKWVFGLSIETLAQTIENSSDFSLSHSTTEALRMFGGDAQGKMSTSFEIDEDAYKLIFK